MTIRFVRFNRLRFARRRKRYVLGSGDSGGRRRNSARVRHAGNSGFVWHGAAAGDFDNDNWIDLFVVGVPAIEQIYATDELSVPLTILIDDKGIVTDLIPGWSAETQRKFNLLTGGETIKSDAPKTTKTNKKRSITKGAIE